MAHKFIHEEFLDWLVWTLKVLHSYAKNQEIEKMIKQESQTRGRRKKKYSTVGFTIEWATVFGGHGRLS